MRFRNYPELLLGSKTKLAIILHFLSSEGPESERELARNIGVSHTAVRKALHDLRDANLLEANQIGNENIWSLREKQEGRDPYSRAALQLEWLAKTPPLQHLMAELRSDFGGPETCIRRSILFGSVGEGREKPDSDIDVFIAVATQAGKKQAQQKVLSVQSRYRHLYGNRLEAHIFTEKEIFSPSNKRLWENIQKGIVIK